MNRRNFSSLALSFLSRIVEIVAVSLTFFLPGEIVFAMNPQFLNELPSISRDAIRRANCSDTFADARDGEVRVRNGDLSDLTELEARQQIVRIALGNFVAGYAHATENSVDLALLELLHLCRESPQKPLIELLLDDLPVQ
jgi:hypothetical protein